jgi:hypothetical protein
MTPFGIARADQFCPKPTPALTSNRYRRDYNEVKDVGDTLANIVLVLRSSLIWCAMSR